VPPVVPRELREHVRLLQRRLVLRLRVDLPESPHPYPDELMKFTVLFRLLFFCSELFEAGFPIV
jgi:hypothetical protein